MIEAKDVSLKYPDGTLALNNVNISINKGELVYITGPSGSGKTSFLKLIMGIEYPTSGSLRVLGQNIEQKEESQIRKMRRSIGPVFQEFRLIKGRTALENVIDGLRIIGFSPRRLKEEAELALDKVGLKHKAKSLVENLSWGEAQRVSIARAVARKPSLILADEPTGNLDYENAVKILNLLASFRNENTAVVITTHATHLIEGFKDATFLRVASGIITKDGGERL
ncbi:MAG: ATP-binding cassette domain-containing protein [Clostridiaceae bacterium]|nr:ATP-binding cassette domain-containing protein [Clostridiaceae bacterium]